MSLAGDWVPVEERLPREYETVLVATAYGVSAGEIRFPGWEDDADEPWWMVFKDWTVFEKERGRPEWANSVDLKDVTHWMPMPPPPRATT